MHSPWDALIPRQALVEGDCICSYSKDSKDKDEKLTENFYVECGKLETIASTLRTNGVMHDRGLSPLSLWLHILKYT